MYLLYSYNGWHTPLYEEYMAENQIAKLHKFATYMYLECSWAYLQKNY